MAQRQGAVEGVVRENDWNSSIVTSIFLSSEALYLHAYVLLFSHQVVSSSLEPHGLQHARPLCPSPSPRVCPSSCSLNQWCCPTVSSFCLPSFPASGSFSTSQLYCIVCILHSWTKSPRIFPPMCFHLTSLRSLIPAEVVSTMKPNQQDKSRLFCCFSRSFTFNLWLIMPHLFSLPVRFTTVFPSLWSSMV